MNGKSQSGPRPAAFSNGAFEAAVSLHRQGLILDAERMYEAQLRAVPNHFGALHNLGLLRAQQGNLEDASALIRKALRRNPKSAEAHNNLGNVLHGMKRYDEANTEFGRALALRSNYAEAHNNRGATLRALGRAQEGLLCYERAIAIAPAYTDAHHNLGNALRTLGRFEEAAACFRRVLSQGQRSAAAHYGLANTLQDLGHYGEAIDHYLSVISLAPGDAEFYYNFGTALLRLNRYEEALVNYQRALVLNPNYAEAYNNLSTVLLTLDRAEEAISCLEKATSLAPQDAGALNNLGQVLLALKRPAEAVDAFERALNLQPDHAVAHNGLGSALRELGSYQEAIEHFESAIKFQAGFAQAYNNLDYALRDAGRNEEAAAALLRAKNSAADVAAAHFSMGNLYAELGRVDAARQALERAVDLEPKNVLYHHALSEIQRFSADSRHLAALEALARDIASLPETEQMHLHFALGKALADVGQHERSFDHQIQANAIKRKNTDYNEAESLAKFDRIAVQFTRERIQSMRGFGDPSETPIFIVGMPRSGTSLIEQILASHPRVFGAGELDIFGRLVVKGRPEVITDEWLRMLGPRYLASVKALAPSVDRITDKMPANSLFVGLIHVALPKARIIYARRDPVDTCLSCFSKLFAGEQAFAYNLQELGRYYRACERLMAHWQSVLPRGVMLEVAYEEVVADLEGQARRIVDYCNLEWDDSCLEFHKADRAVRTASVLQVREPIYRSSVGRWRPYARLLAPLLEALEVDVSAFIEPGEG